MHGFPFFKYHNLVRIWRNQNKNVPDDVEKERDVKLQQTVWFKKQTKIKLYYCSYSGLKHLCILCYSSTAVLLISKSIDYELSDKVDWPDLAALLHVHNRSNRPHMDP